MAVRFNGSNISNDLSHRINRLYILSIIYTTDNYIFCQACTCSLYKKIRNKNNRLVVQVQTKRVIGKLLRYGIPIAFCRFRAQNDVLLL